MWRLLGVLAALAVLGTLVTSHGTSLAQPPSFQLLCHVTGPERAAIIRVPQNAVEPLLGRGDCLINSTDAGLVGQECNPTDANDNNICDVQP
jgi:hypothetical protein